MGAACSLLSSSGIRPAYQPPVPECSPLSCAPECWRCWPSLGRQDIFSSTVNASSLDAAGASPHHGQHAALPGPEVIIIPYSLCKCLASCCPGKRGPLPPDTSPGQGVSPSPLTQKCSCWTCSRACSSSPIHLSLIPHPDPAKTPALLDHCSVPPR